MSARPEVLELPYLAGRDWFEREILAGRLPERRHMLVVTIADLEPELLERALRLHAAVALDRPHHVEVHGTGIDPTAEDPYGGDPLDVLTMHRPILSQIKYLPELEEPTQDAEPIIVAWEAWVSAYRERSDDALRAWAERWHPGDGEPDGSVPDGWWQTTLRYRTADGDGERVRSITFDSARDFELFRRVRAADALISHGMRVGDINDVTAADEATGGTEFVDGTFPIGTKPPDREALVGAYEEYAARWRAVALAARSNRLRQKDAFEEEMRRWADDHGSDRLQLGLEDGFRMTRVYLQERLTLEFPGFYAWAEGAPGQHWKPRTGPSGEALQGRRKVQEMLDETEGGAGLRADIVWMTDPPSEMVAPWWHDPFDKDDVHPFEAVVVERWLGRYTLVGPVSSEEAPVPKALNWAPAFGVAPDFSALESGVDDDIPF